MTVHDSYSKHLWHLLVANERTRSHLQDPHAVRASVDHLLSSQMFHVKTDSSGFLYEVEVVPSIIDALSR